MHRHVALTFSHSSYELCMYVLCCTVSDWILLAFPLLSLLPVLFSALLPPVLCSSPTLGPKLSDCLPGRTKLEHITSAILSHVTSPDQPLATMMLGLKVLLSLCQYDAGLLNVYRYDTNHTSVCVCWWPHINTWSFVMCTHLLLRRLLPTHVNGFSFILERLTKAIRYMCTFYFPSLHLPHSSCSYSSISSFWRDEHYCYSLP